MPPLKLSRRDLLKFVSLSWLTSSVGDLAPRLSRLKAQSLESADVLVLGAGMAGLSAARHLADADWQVITLEARSRLGGRIWTDNDLAGYPIELGAEFVHGSQVATWQLLERYNLTARPDHLEQAYAFWRGQIQPADELPFDPYGALAEIDELAETWTDSEAQDVALSQFISQVEAMQDLEARRLISNLFALDNAAELEQYGTYGYMEASYEGDGADDGDWRVEQGYGALVQALAQGLDVRLNDAVTRIAYDDSGVEVTTQSGKRYQAYYAVISLPLGVLQSGAVSFDPPLPAEQLNAITGLGVGKVNKLVLKFSEPWWAGDLNTLATSLDSQLWWRSGYGRQNEVACLTALIGGASGARYSQLSEADAIQRGLDDLSRMAGRSLAGLLDTGKFVNWGADPYSLMGYSYVPVGASGLRRAYARPVQDVLFFAGEATHETRPATVHGAHESGIRTAQAILQRG